MKIEIQPAANWESAEGWVRLSENFRRNIKKRIGYLDLIFLKINKKLVVTQLKGITHNYNMNRKFPLKGSFDGLIVINEHYRGKLGFEGIDTPISIERDKIRIKKLSWYNPINYCRFIYYHPNVIVKSTTTISIIALIVSFFSLIIALSVL